MDFIPNKRTERYLWLKNLSLNVVAEAVKMGAPAADATAAKALADDLIAKYEATDAASTLLDGARTVEKTHEATDLTGLRAKVRNWKTLSAYPASGSEGVLKLKGTDAPFEPGVHKLALKVSIEAGKIKVEFKKMGVDAVAIYSRLRGAAAWKKIGTDTASPYFDTTPLAQAGVPEVREYMARGLVGDEEVGLDSDIVSVTFAG